jgi:FtsZ-binding cell division protein ZapB
MEQSKPRIQYLSRRDSSFFRYQTRLDFARANKPLPRDWFAVDRLRLLQQTLREGWAQQAKPKRRDAAAQDTEYFLWRLHLLPDQIDTISAMQTDIETLAEKTDALIAIVNQLRLENTQLRSDVARLTAEHRDIEQRLHTAADKVERMLQQLPQES